MNTLNTKNNIKIAILYIATGRYTVFWEHFYRSAEKNLLSNCHKHYFVFTDSTVQLLGENTINVTRIEQQKLGWPYDTLMRFDMFLSIKNQLLAFDYVYFFNANTEIIQPITTDEFLPTEQEGLLFAHQPHMFHLTPSKFTYEANTNSTAYIPPNQGKYYVTGALNGGTVKAYLQMCKRLSDNIHQDLKNSVIAIWHDESHLNHYLFTHQIGKILPPYFTKGEHETWKHTAKIMFTDKTHYRFGGHAYLRGESNEKISQEEWEKLYGKQKKCYKFRIKQYLKSLIL